MSLPRLPPLPALMRSKSPDDTLNIAQALAQELEPGHIVLLHGPLGSGKTLFVRGICRGLGMKELWEVSSPTYTLVNAYPAGPGVLHLDLYRIEGRDDLEAIDFDGILTNAQIKLIEWPERISDFPFHGRGFVVSFTVTGPEHCGREIHIKAFHVSRNT